MNAIKIPRYGDKVNEAIRRFNSVKNPSKGGIPNRERVDNKIEMKIVIDEILMSGIVCLLVFSKISLKANNRYAFAIACIDKKIKRVSGETVRKIAAIPIWDRVEYASRRGTSSYVPARIAP